MLVHRAKTPRPLKDIEKTLLPVVWAHSKNAWVTRTIFTEWYRDTFLPFLETYCKEENIDYRALLLMDNATCHPENLHELDPRVKILYSSKCNFSNSTSISGNNSSI